MLLVSSSGVDLVSVDAYLLLFVEGKRDGVDDCWFAMQNNAWFAMQSNSTQNRWRIISGMNQFAPLFINRAMRIKQEDSSSDEDICRLWNLSRCWCSARVAPLLLLCLLWAGHGSVELKRTTILVCYLVVTNSSSYCNRL